MEPNKKQLKINVLFGHPKFSRSVMNKELIKVYKDKDYVTFTDIYDTYPDFIFDKEEEHRKCEEADVIIFHFPVFLFGPPSIFKEWLDNILDFNWAFGKRYALRNKYFLPVLTCAGKRIAYGRLGFNRYTFKEMLTPIYMVANLCSMRSVLPYVVDTVDKSVTKRRIHKECYMFDKLIGHLHNDYIEELGHFNSHSSLNESMYSHRIALDEGYKIDPNLIEEKESKDEHEEGSNDNHADASK